MTGRSQGNGGHGCSLLVRETWSGTLNAVWDRFMIDGEDAGGRFALVQHLFAPRALATPLHRHHKEDECTFVLDGRIEAILGDDEVVAEQGDLIFKPHNGWHTFCNAGDEPASVLELISPLGSSSSFVGWAR